MDMCRHSERSEILLSRLVRLHFVPVCLLLSSCLTTGSEMKQSGLEKAVCGFYEPLVFWLWNSMAGQPDSDRVADLPNVEDISLVTVDGRMLRGYKLKSRPVSGAMEPRAYLLVVPGNAMLSDQILGSFTRFTSKGIDVYIFDYRGYGRSSGKRRLKALVSDYGEIIDWLNSMDYKNRLFYAMSFGGVLLLNALRERTADSVVIDSTPSRLSGYGCPEAYDPVTNLPSQAGNLLFIAGAKDRIVTPRMSRELIETAQQRGASVLHDPDMSHPFKDRSLTVRERRMQAVSSFLLKPITDGE